MGIAFIGIPFYSLAKYRGMADAVQTLRTAGIVDRLRSVDSRLLDIGDVDCPTIVDDRGPSNLRNFETFLDGTLRIRRKMLQGLNSSRLTFCLGGECAFVVGTLAALKTIHKGTPGMVWMDAHGDFNTPQTSPSGFIGGMPLALACGEGPRLSPEIESARPLLSAKHVVHVGSRSVDPGEDSSLVSSVKVFSAKAVKERGAHDIARETAWHMSDSCDWIVAHLDVDVFDTSIMPAVNFPEPRGLGTKDVLEIFHALHRTEKLAVVDLTAYNPSRDLNRNGESLILQLAPKLVAPA